MADQGLMRIILPSAEDIKARLVPVTLDTDFYIKIYELIGLKAGEQCYSFEVARMFYTIIRNICSENAINAALISPELVADWIRALFDDKQFVEDAVAHYKMISKK